MRPTFAPFTRALLAGSVLAAVVLTLGCKTSAGSSDEATAGKAQETAKHLRFDKAPPGDVPEVVLAAVAREKANGRRVVVYEGASWCEPCQNFHAAVASGKLDATFPDLTLLEFDADKDKDRLVAAGYGSQYIPLFALPGNDGRALGPKAAGGIKGDGVVPYLTQKLQQLLAKGS